MTYSRMSDKDKTAIEKMYFNLNDSKILGISEIMEHFNGRYTYAEVKKVINDYYSKH